MSKKTGDVDQQYQEITAHPHGYNVLGNIFNTIGLKTRSHKLYLFTTFALVLIGLIVCIPTVIVPKTRSSEDK
jgi:hypothetical protein